MYLSNQNNHIQIPKSILKNFSTLEKHPNQNGFFENHNMVFRMEMDGSISKSDIKECNSELGFYSEIKEQQLSKIETLFGDIKKKIFNSIKLNNKLFFSIDEIIIIRLFFLTGLSRSQVFVNQIKKHVLFRELLHGNIDEYIMQEIESETIFDDYMPMVIVNKSNCRFILPQKYWYTLHVEGFSLNIMPLSPDIAIVLQKQLLESNINCLDLVESLHGNIDVLNKIAIKEEVSDNRQALYAKDKEDLEKYIPYLQTLSKKQ